MKILLINAYRNKDKIKKLRDFLREAVNEVIVTSNDDVPEGDFSGVVISGSENLITEGEYSETLISFIKSAGKPVLGICFGYQIIAYSSGGIIKDTGKELKKTITVEIIKQDKIFYNLPRYITVAESHREYVDIKSIKTHFEVLAKSEFTEVEAIVHKKLPIYGVQFHIERSGNIGKIILKNFLSIVSVNESYQK